MIGISSILSQPFTPLEFHFDEFFFSDCERSSFLFMIIHRLKTIYLEDTSCKHCVRRINLENSGWKVIMTRNVYWSLINWKSGRTSDINMRYILLWPAIGSGRHNQSTRRILTDEMNEFLFLFFYLPFFYHYHFLKEFRWFISTLELNS